MLNIKKLITSKSFIRGNLIANILTTNIMFLIFSLLTLGVEKPLALKIAILMIAIFMLFLCWVNLVLLFYYPEKPTQETD